MYPSGLTITPEPRLSSRCERGFCDRLSNPGPKNCRKKGSLNISSGSSACARTTLDVDIFTTSGKTAFTMGANPVLLGPSFGSANLMEASVIPLHKTKIAQKNQIT